MRAHNLDPLVAVIPYFGEEAFIRRAVESVLGQQQERVDALVVVNDSHATWPTQALEGVDDPRLILFNLDLGRSRGPYFAKEVVRRALPQTGLLATLDADDMWHPLFVERCMRAVNAGASSAIAGPLRKRLDGGCDTWTKSADDQLTSISLLDLPSNDGVYLHHVSPPEINQKMFFRTLVQGIFRSHALGVLGGFYGGEHLAYDCFLGTVLLMHGGGRLIPDLVYMTEQRADSLSQCDATGQHSDMRRLAMSRLQRRHNRVYKTFVELRPDLDMANRPVFAARVAQQTRRSISPRADLELDESARALEPLLAAVMGSPTDIATGMGA